MKSKFKILNIKNSFKIENYKLKIGAVGAATFFFGFGAGALLNLYLLWIKSSLVLELRSSLNYTSAIVGDGLILPIVNMIVVSFLFKNKSLISRADRYLMVLMGAGITAYFHITQAVNGLVNWAMPAPWQWNFLGLWHAIYMFAVSSLLSLFLIVVVQFVRKNNYIPREALMVSTGVILFLVLLRMDYSTVSLQSVIP